MSSFQWDRIYSQKQMAQYPDTELVRFVARNYYGASNRKDVKFLDVGCGAGASTWYLAREGFSVAAVDGSLVATERLRKRLVADKLEALIICTDISKLSFKDDYFDCIVDISSLCYVPEDSIDELMGQLHKVLKPGGKIFTLTPTVTCAKEPFNSFVEGIELDARFLDYHQVRDQFSLFKQVKITSCSFGDEKARINLWETHGVK